MTFVLVDYILVSSPFLLVVALGVMYFKNHHKDSN